jgi:hypothetical protein
MEIYVTWNYYEEKNYLVKIHKDTSVEYLKFDIINTMERHNKKLFSGLKNLTVQNLRKANKSLIPERGEVADIIKSNDHLYFDLNSDDIWLHVSIEVPSKDSIITLECKVRNDFPISQLKEYLVDTTN